MTSPKPNADHPHAAIDPSRQHAKPGALSADTPTIVSRDPAIETTGAVDGPHVKTVGRTDHDPADRDQAETIIGTPDDVPTLIGGNQSVADATRTLVQSGGGAGSSSLVGQTIGDFELLREIARGGMGVVYKARQVSLDRIVALKMILSGQFAGEEEFQRFEIEARAAAGLDHPGIVPVFQIGTLEGQHFLAMGFVDGQSLHEAIGGQPMPPSEAARTAKLIAEAIAVAHDHGIVHRDLKPGNILVGRDGRPRVADFGLAKSVEGGSNMTISGQILGTPSYMAPEQARGDVVGTSADIYAIGGILYAMLTGRPPFQASSVMHTLQLVTSQPPVSPKALNPAIDRDLETIVLKCLEKTPDDRFAAASQLVDELGRHERGEPIRSRPIGRVVKAARWCQRHLAATGLMVAGVLLAATIPLIVTASNKARMAAETAKLTQDFEQQLADFDLQADQWNALETLSRRLDDRVIDAEETAASRFVDHAADKITLAMQQPRLLPADRARIETAIERLASLPGAGAAHGRIDSEWAAQQANWTVAFAASEQDALRSAFAPGTFRTTANGVSAAEYDRWTPGRWERTEELGSNFAATLVESTWPLTSATRGVVTFDESWEQSFELGLTLNAVDGLGYDFVLRNPDVLSLEATFESKRKPMSLARQRAERGVFRLEIRRGLAVLHRSDIAADELPVGPLTIEATRAGNELTMTVGSLSPVRGFDPFPFRTADEGRFGVRVGYQSTITALRMDRRPRDEAMSLLERGDTAFANADFKAAADAYRSQLAQPNLSESVQQECRYKIARCRLELGETDEATGALQELFTQPGEPWPPLAGIALWNDALDRDNTDDASAILNLLTARYADETLRSLVPAELRRRIIRRAFAVFDSPFELLKDDPDRLRKIRQAVNIDRILSHDGEGSFNARYQYSRALRLEGRFEEAAEVLEGLTSWHQSKSDRNYIRTLRRLGRDDEAVAFVKQRIDDAGNSETIDAQTRVTLLVELARLHLSHGESDEALAMLDLTEPLLASIDIPRRHDAVLNERMVVEFVRGEVYRRRGDLETADALWKQAVEQSRDAVRRTARPSDNTTVGYMIVASLAGAMGPADTQDLFDKVVSQYSGGLPGIAQSLVSQDLVHRVLSTMWRTDRGRDWAAGYADGSIAMRDRILTPIKLAAYQMFRLEAFGGTATDEQDDVLWSLANDLIDAVITTDNWPQSRIMQVGLAWKGQTGFLGWGGVRSQLTAVDRGRLAYLLAHRSRRRGNANAAVAYLKEAASLEGAPQTVHDLAKRELDAIDAP